MVVTRRNVVPNVATLFVQIFNAFVMVILPVELKCIYFKRKKKKEKNGSQIMQLTVNYAILV